MISTSSKASAAFYSGLSFEDDFNPTSPNRDTISSPTMLPFDGHANRKKKDSPKGDKFTEQQSTRPKENLTNYSISQQSLPQPSPLTAYVIRLSSGDELRKSLLDYVSKMNLKAAFVMTCVGSASSAKLRLANATPDMEANYMLDITHPTEIVSLEGTLSGGGHMHVALSDMTGKILGGHLIELVIHTTAEIVIGECHALKFNRVFDEKTGYKELSINCR